MSDEDTHAGRIVADPEGAIDQLSNVLGQAVGAKARGELAARLKDHRYVAVANGAGRHVATDWFQSSASLTFPFNPQGSAPAPPASAQRWPWETCAGSWSSPQSLIASFGKPTGCLTNCLTMAAPKGAPGRTVPPSR